MLQVSPIYPLTVYFRWHASAIRQVRREAAEISRGTVAGRPGRAEFESQSAGSSGRVANQKALDRLLEALLTPAS
jgi:hypothetical protein